jgi:hypothetical protein
MGHRQPTQDRFLMRWPMLAGALPGQNRFLMTELVLAGAQLAGSVRKGTLSSDGVRRARILAEAE